MGVGSGPRVIGAQAFLALGLPLGTVFVGVGFQVVNIN
jgi:hypothetical protein